MSAPDIGLRPLPKALITESPRASDSMKYGSFGTRSGRLRAGSVGRWCARAPFRLIEYSSRRQDLRILNPPPGAVKANIGAAGR
jgi:hypothetical protein